MSIFVLLHARRRQKFWRFGSAKTWFSLFLERFWKEKYEHFEKNVYFLKNTPPPCYRSGNNKEGDILIKGVFLTPIALMFWKRIKTLEATIAMPCHYKDSIATCTDSFCRIICWRWINLGTTDLNGIQLIREPIRTQGMALSRLRVYSRRETLLPQRFPRSCTTTLLDQGPWVLF